VILAMFGVSLLFQRPVLLGELDGSKDNRTVGSIIASTYSKRL